MKTSVMFLVLAYSLTTWTQDVELRKVCENEIMFAAQNVTMATYQINHSSVEQKFLIKTNYDYGIVTINKKILTLRLLRVLLSTNFSSILKPV